jgi:hypothetical protein
MRDKTLAIICRFFVFVHKKKSMSLYVVPGTGTGTTVTSNLRAMQWAPCALTSYAVMLMLQFKVFEG